MPAISAPDRRRAIFSSNLCPLMAQADSQVTFTSGRAGHGEGVRLAGYISFILAIFFIDIAATSQEYAPASHRLGWPTRPASLFSRSELQTGICLRRSTPANRRVCMTDSL